MKYNELLNQFTKITGIEFVGDEYSKKRVLGSSEREVDNAVRMFNHSDFSLSTGYKASAQHDRYKDTSYVAFIRF